MNFSPLRQITVVVVLLLASTVASALDPTKTVFQYNCQNWTRAAGLPAEKISGITQTPDGYLWFGGQNGLIRYDGMEFKVVGVDLPAAQGQDVRRLSRAPDGKIWFNITSGGYGGYDGSKFYPINDARWNAAGANSNTVLATRDGSVWTGSVFGYGRWVDGHADETIFDEKLGVVISLAEDPMGRVWLGTAERGLFYWENGTLKAFPDNELKHRNIQAIAQDHSGDLWVGTSLGLYRYDANFHRKEIYYPNIQTNVLLVDRQGTLWAGTNELGLARYAEGEFTQLQRTDGLGSDNVSSLFEDAEGSLWIGTVEGVSQLSDLKFPIFSTKEGLVSGGATAVAPSRNGGVWVVTSSGASLMKGRSVVNYTSPDLFPNRYVRRVFEGKNGDVYFGDGNKNICILSNGLPKARYNIDQWPESFAEDATGVVVGIGPSLYRLTNNGLEPYPFSGEAPFVDWYNYLTVARDGAIWAGTNNGILRIKDGNVQHWTAADGLTSNRVHYVVEDDDGNIWGGMPTGLFRIRDGKVRAIGMNDGLADARIYAIVPDRHGNMWLCSGNGILRVTLQNLKAFIEHRVKQIECEKFDGLESVKFIDRTDQGYSACLAADGRIWMPTPGGAVMIDPEHYTINKVPPKVHIQKVGVQGRTLSDKRDSVLKVGDRTVEFYFTALSFVSPKKMQIRYKLDGFDAHWIDAGAHRSVLYNNLPAGRYTFQVQAANADGIWNHTGDSFTVDLPPPFYQRIWFYALCVVLAGLALAGTYRWNIRKIRAAQRRLKLENDRLEASVTKRTEDLAKSVSLLNATLESVADGIVAIDRSGRVISYNTKFLDIWNFPPELLQTRDARKLRAHSATLVKDAEAYTRRMNDTQSDLKVSGFDVIELKDGRVFERYVAPQRIGDEAVGIVVNWRDVTERRRAQAAEAEASALLDTLLHNTPDYIYFKDRDSRFVRYSEAMRERFGTTALDSLLGKTDFDVHTAELATAARADELQIMQTGEAIIDKLESERLPHGSIAWTLTTKMPWRGPRGDIIGTFGVSRNITAIKEAEAKLAYERDLLRSLLDSSPDQIYFKDLQSRFLKCSKAQGRNFKLADPDEMIGKTDFDFFTEEHARPAFEDEQDIIRTGEPLVAKVEHETWADGRETWVLTNKMPLRDGRGEIIGTVGISKDVTALKQAEKKLEVAHQQLVETSRQAGMAEVATSVLHNVGNVLNSVNVSATLVSDQIRDSKVAYVAKVADLLQSRAGDLATFLTQDPRGLKVSGYLSSLSSELLSEQHKIIDELGHLRKNIEHIKEIVAMQQSFAKVSGVTEAISISELIEDALRINSSSLTRHEVELIRDFKAQRSLVLDRHKVMQILVNLIRNAKYACDDSGLPDKKIIVRSVETADRVIISVIDNGVGIPKENLTRIFAHGFTTKKEGHGFGLHSGALAAKELGGTLVALSDGPGKGAEFILELPLDPQPKKGS